MDGLNRVLGRIVTPLALPDGRTLHLTPLTLADFAEEESFHASGRDADPEIVLRDLLTIDFDSDGTLDELRAHLEKAAEAEAKNWRALFNGGEVSWRPKVEPEAFNFATSPEGLAWRLVRSARKHHPNLTLAEGYELVGRFAKANRLGELIDTIYIAVGLRDLRFMVTPTGSGGGPDQWRTTWLQYLPHLAREYGWGPEQVCGLTLYQLAFYMGQLGPESGVTSTRAR